MQTLNPSEEHIVKWADYVRSHKDWKKLHTEFIDAQFMKYDNFRKRILATAEGKDKLRLLEKQFLL